MTNKNTNWIREPFLLKPAVKDYLWGGNRLNDEFTKGIDVFPLAETWECSANADGVSVINSGVFNGLDLLYLISIHPEFLGSHHKTTGKLPILVKLIDAREDLSIQVHPDDNYARRYENGEYGKTEMWYVLAASKDSHLVYGLRNKVSKAILREAIENGTIENYLQKIYVKKNDVFLVKPGTIHAIGKGTLIAEIQQNSNLTYRLYDYDRIDKNGNKRSLHIEKALDVIDFDATKEPKQPVRLMKYYRGLATEVLCRCKYFQVERMLINTERLRTLVEMKSDELSFQVLLCVDGCGTITGESGTQNFFKGDCFFVPASSTYLLHGVAQMLRVTC